MPLLCKRVRSHNFIKTSRIRHIFIYLCESWIRDSEKYFACANCYTPLFRSSCFRLVHYTASSGTIRECGNTVRSTSKSTQSRTNLISRGHKRPHELQKQNCCRRNIGSQPRCFLRLRKRPNPAGQKARCNQESQSACGAHGRGTDSVAALGVSGADRQLEEQPCRKGCSSKAGAAGRCRCTSGRRQGPGCGRCATAGGQRKCRCCDDAEGHSGRHEKCERHSRRLHYRRNRRHQEGDCQSGCN